MHPIFVRFFTIFCFVFSSLFANAAEFTLERYLDQVRAQNPKFRAGIEQNLGGDLRSDEGDLLVTPVLHASAQRSSDSKQPQAPFVRYDKIRSDNYSLGLSELTPFGLEAKLSYNVSRIEYVNFTYPFSLHPISYLKRKLTCHKIIALY